MYGVLMRVTVVRVCKITSMSVSDAILHFCKHDQMAWFVRISYVSMITHTEM